MSSHKLYGSRGEHHSSLSVRAIGPRPPMSRWLSTVALALLTLWFPLLQASALAATAELDAQAKGALGEDRMNKVATAPPDKRGLGMRKAYDPTQSNI